ncbi:hypothetical protein AB0I10_40565 [Streptomyces sp. NPDC050636]|uniref:hypothetical protein n=1 Tax=Streptomyces sp. NPDC050636 TaxID=3154510 RepID=UPI003442AACD
MLILAWTMVILGGVTVAACAAHLARRHRQEPAQLVRALHRTVPVLLAAGVFPVPVLLATDGLAAAWGLWGVTIIAAALVHCTADTCCDVPAARHAHRGRKTA